jgi:HD-GYP domain-containing protein (c-di-GMP phosphodiesterase class II)
MNLEVYLATSVELVNSGDLAIAELRGKKKFDLIVSLDLTQKKETFKLIYDYLKAYGIKTPIIKLGGSADKDIDAKAFEIASRYNIQAILKKSASLLGVTAKQMAEMQVGDYYPVSLRSVEQMGKAPCTIYQQVGAEYKAVARKDEILESSLKILKGNNTQQVFVRSHDRLILINIASLNLVEKISSTLLSTENISTEAKVQNLSDGYEFAAANLFSTDEVKQEMQQIATASSKVMQDVAKDIPTLKGLLATMTSNKTGYIFTHSMIASYVAQHIIKHVAWGGDGQTEKINFVLFFHDIYLAPIFLKHPELQFEKNLLDNPALSEKEKEIVINHARLAAELVVSYKKCPMGADILIKHHHGMKKGSGFATRYPEDLSPLTKVLLIAEAFVEHFIATTNQKKKVDMKQIIPQLIEEFATPSYVKIVQTLVNLPI